MAYASMEEALASLTHLCRNKPGLKINPRDCEYRKAVIAARRMDAVVRIGVYWSSICSACQGPIALDGSETRLEKVTLKSVKKPPVHIDIDPSNPPVLRIKANQVTRTCTKCGAKLIQNRKNFRVLCAGGVHQYSDECIKCDPKKRGLGPKRVKVHAHAGRPSLRDPSIEKTCSNCGDLFSNTKDNFYVTKRGGLDNMCKWCRSATNNKRQQEKKCNAREGTTKR